MPLEFLRKSLKLDEVDNFFYLLLNARHFSLLQYRCAYTIVSTWIAQLVESLKALGFSSITGCLTQAYYPFRVSEMSKQWATAVEDCKLKHMAM